MKSNLKPAWGKLVVLPIEVVVSSKLIINEKKSYSEGIVKAVYDEVGFKIGDHIIYKSSDSVQIDDLVVIDESDVIATRNERN